MSTYLINQLFYRHTTKHTQTWCDYVHLFNQPIILQTRNKAYTDMVRLCVTSGISNCSHSAVTLCFFECMVRYEKFFTMESHHLPAVLASFFDHRGMKNPQPKVHNLTPTLFWFICYDNYINNYDAMSQIF